MGVDTAQNILPLIPVSETADGADQNIIDRLSAERSELQRQVQTLQKELEKAKIASNDLETFKKQSETAFVNLEEVSKENESYRKKLETVKCLEKQIDELKCQAKLLTEKYRWYVKEKNAYNFDSKLTRLIIAVSRRKQVIRLSS